MILQQVTLQLPVGMIKLTGLTIEDKYFYHMIATTHAVATSKTIRLFIDIPLTATDRYSELYKVQSLTFFRMGINRYIMPDNRNFLQ